MLGAAIDGIDVDQLLSAVQSVIGRAERLQALRRKSINVIKLLFKLASRFFFFVWKISITCNASSLSTCNYLTACRSPSATAVELRAEAISIHLKIQPNSKYLLRRSRVRHFIGVYFNLECFISSRRAAERGGAGRGTGSAQRKVARIVGRENASAGVAEADILVYHSLHHYLMFKQGIVFGARAREHERMKK